MHGNHVILVKNKLELREIPHSAESEAETQNTKENCCLIGVWPQIRGLIWGCSSLYTQLRVEQYIYLFMNNEGH